MALDAFNKLKDVKRKRVMTALAKCLTVHDYDELSINEIAIEAGISRGSFYNYFVDKNDAVRTLVVSKLEALKDILKNTIIDNDGYLFESIRKIYVFIKNILKNDFYCKIITNIKFIMGITLKVVDSKQYEEEMSKLVDWLIANTREGQAFLNTKEHMSNMLHMIIMLLLNVTVREITGKECQNTDEDFYYKIDVLEKGSKAVREK